MADAGSEKAAKEAPRAWGLPRAALPPEVHAELVDSNPTGMQVTFLGTGDSSMTPGRCAHPNQEGAPACLPDGT